MDYWPKYVYCLVMILYPHCSVPVDAHCWKDEAYSRCKYTVICTDMPTYIDNPPCEDTPNVTFILRGISTNKLYSSIFYETSNVFDQRVRAIIAQENNWVAVRSLALRFYKHITYLDLSANGIEEIETEAFSKLESMKFLNLSNNAISILYNSSFRITDSSALEILDLSNNRLPSLDDGVFSYFPNLLELYLYKNNLKTLSDACFSNLGSLQTLLIQSNSITHLNLTLIPLRSVTHIDISQNHIGNLFGFEMVSLVSLETLNISRNNIESVDRNTFKKITKLKVLDLSYNRIVAQLEEDIFENNHNLKYLDLFNNNLESLPAGLFKSIKLDYINLERNNITGDINNILIGVDNVTSINITNQQITAIKNFAFSNIRHLKHLNLSHNHISNIESSSFDNSTTLNILDLSFNEIATLSFFEKLDANLTEIYLNNNKLSTVPEKAFIKYKTLKKLDVSQNVIVSIGQNAIPLTQLEFMGIHQNNISGVIVKNVYTPASHLTVLDLSNFHIEQIGEYALIDSPYVARVNLSHNYIELIHSSNFKGFDKMISLDLSNNKLKTIVLDITLNQLQAIYLHKNKLSTVPDIFGNNSKLESLHMSHNYITNMWDSKIKNLLQLRVLTLAFNKITKFNNDYTNSLQYLTELKLMSNNIEEMVNISFYKDLQNLNVSNNRISAIDKSHFGNQNSLLVLSLDRNLIKVITPGVFEYLSSLRILDLSSNSIEQFRFGSLRGLNETIGINMSKNKLKHLDEEVFHECPALRVLIIDDNDITEINVEKMVNVTPSLSILSLGGNPMACHEVLRNKRGNHGVTLTSVRKVYHEDNVHGIKCGAISNNDTLESSTDSTSESKSTKNDAIFIWCGIIGGLLTVAFVTFYFTKRYANRVNPNRVSMQFQNLTSNSESFSNFER